ncbi:hypothetical protein DUNSADRAFT_12553 [Dunaliella salina]|uniref:Mediator of RNA polymerase II transcription subunit 30 n=1 Tax=Dunaliella salina TaxID=3046 RepID=A0ABQ7GB21_DUNSA|nr:hypothetical protein DUNSADRAFT_12553 [Dunaliella salina]|eukprot:KAF5831807.1 hypothetical protein DUNSADRAFT_12553 [Dunaliella salina]
MQALSGFQRQEAEGARCIEHLNRAVGAAKQLLDGLIQSSTVSEGGPDSQHHAQEYKQHTEALREGLKAMFQHKAEHERAAAEAPPSSSQELEQLRAKKAALEQRIQECCGVEKALIDTSRSLLDAMACWDATQKQLG